MSIFLMAARFLGCISLRLGHRVAPMLVHEVLRPRRR